MSAAPTLEFIIFLGCVAEQGLRKKSWFGWKNVRSAGGQVGDVPPRGPPAAISLRGSRHGHGGRGVDECSTHALSGKH